jgi:CoA:oxalate CoA-transferase
VPFEPFDTQSIPLMLAIGNDKLWQTFCKLTNASFSDDPRFATNPQRSDNYASLRPLLAELMLTKTAEEWQEAFDAAGIPNGPINTIDKVVANQQVLAREMIVEVDHPRTYYQLSL